MNKLLLVFRPGMPNYFILNTTRIESDTDYLVDLDDVSHDHLLRIENLFIVIKENRRGSENRLPTDSPRFRLYKREEKMKACHEMILAGIYEIHFVSAEKVEISYLGEEK